MAHLSCSLQFCLSPHPYSCRFWSWQLKVSHLGPVGSPRTWHGAQHNLKKIMTHDLRLQFSLFGKEPKDVVVILNGRWCGVWWAAGRGIRGSRNWDQRSAQVASPFSIFYGQGMNHSHIYLSPCCFPVLCVYFMHVRCSKKYLGEAPSQ
jgi:hypothetical protein